MLAKYCLLDSMSTRFGLYLRMLGHTLYKIYPNRTSEGSICHCVRDVAPVIWQPSPDIVIHATTWAEHTVPSPPNLIVEGVRIRVFGDHVGNITRSQLDV